MERQALFENRFVMAALFSCAAIVCLQYLFLTVGYLSIPTYLDQVEPAVASTAELLLRGQQIFPSWESGDGLYGMIYGPVLYFIHAGVLLVVKSIFATKIAGVLAIWAALYFMALEVKQVTRSAPMVFLALGGVVFFLLKFGHATFWNRPEPFLIFVVAVALSALRLPRYRAAVAIGLCCGVAIGLKPFAALFIAPIMLVLVVREARFAVGVRIGALASAIAGAAAMAPFLHPSVSLHGYIEYLNIAAEHGLSLRNFYVVMHTVAIILVPIALIYLLRRPKWSREIRWLTIALVGCIAIVSVVGSKRGAGGYHLLPFLPIALYLIVWAATSIDRLADPSIGKRAAIHFLFSLYLLSLSPFAISSALKLDRRIIDSRHERSLVGELTKIYAAHPQSEMGVADDRNYSFTLYRVVGVLAGTPVHLDLPFLMDLRAVGLGGREAEELVESCKVGEWIVPAEGIPFSKSNFYAFEGEWGLFSDRFRQLFERNYQIVFSGNFYNVWGCREGNSPA